MDILNFRLLSELYSLLCELNIVFNYLKNEFPSPLGVIFSLILFIFQSSFNIQFYLNSFRLLSELYSLL